MKHLHPILALFMPTVVLLSGCAASDIETPVDQDIRLSLDPTAGGGSAYEPPSGKNGLKPSEFWSSTAQLAYRDMQNERLEGSIRDIAGVPTSILNAPTGSPLYQLLITYPEAATDLIQCALEPKQMVYDDITGKEIYGWFGLAPNWLHERLAGNVDQEEWLTGCMLGRLNYVGFSVNILLEGDTTAIQTHAAWDPVFPYNESTVFGNMFNSTTPITDRDPAFLAYICRENDLAFTCIRDGGSTYVNNRICDDVPFLCGLVDIGLCDPAAVGSLGACKYGTTSEYWNCLKEPSSTTLDVRTVGVQLEYRIDQATCF
jgi:hypothetical protein